MNTRASLFPQVEREVVSTPPEHRRGVRVPVQSQWDPASFANEQIRRLVRQVFCPGWPKPARHVVFSAVDRDTDVAGICLQVGEVLTQHVDGRVGVIETTLEMPEFEDVFGVAANRQTGRDDFASLRSTSHQISNHLWLVPPTSFWGNEESLTVASLECTIREMRLDFDYTVLHASPAGVSSEAVALGHMCDGVILVLEAHETHRVAAQKVKETLQAANVRVLGTVLSGRTFPIPESLYRRL